MYLAITSAFSPGSEWSMKKTSDVDIVNTRQNIPNLFNMLFSIQSASMNKIGPTEMLCRPTG
jgi:hypothetical protein